MKAYAQSTFDANVLTGLGSFGGMYALGSTVLVSGTDGVGTKLKAAFALGRHDTVGIDCVAMPPPNPASPRTTSSACDRNPFEYRRTDHHSVGRS